MGDNCTQTSSISMFELVLQRCGTNFTGLELEVITSLHMAFRKNCMIALTYQTVLARSLDITRLFVILKMLKPLYYIRIIFTNEQ